MPPADNDAPPDGHDDAARLLSELFSHRLPAAVLREALAAGADDAALYVVDIDGSCLLKLTGGDAFPEHLQTPLGIGPELATESLAEVDEIVAAKVPDADVAALRVRDRALGVLVTRGGDPGRLQALADQAALALELAGGYTDVIHRDAPAQGDQRGGRDPAEPAAAAHRHGRRARTSPAACSPATRSAATSSTTPRTTTACGWRSGDAMGKGNNAAAISSLAVGALRAARRNDATLEQAAEVVHEATFDVGGPYQFLTAVLAVWHCDSGTLAWINCGHPRPLLADPDGSVRELADDGTYPLGMFRRRRAFRRTEVRTEPGQRILLYSDGLPERRAAGGELFGVENVERILRERAGATTARAVRAPAGRGARLLAAPAARRRDAAARRHRPARGLRHSGLDEPAADRVAGELDAVAHAELVEHARAMALDGLRADDERLGDLAGWCSASAISLRTSVSRGVSGSSATSSPAAARAEAVLISAAAAPGYRNGSPRIVGAAGVDEVAVDRRLEHVARRARAQRLEEVLLVVVHREHEDPQRRARGGRARPPPAARSGAASRRRGRRGRRRSASASATACAPSAASATTREVRLGARDDAAAPRRTTAWSSATQHARLQRRAHATGISRRTRCRARRRGRRAGARARAARARASRVMPRASSPTWAGTPRPSSSTVSATAPSACASSIDARRAPAWRATLVSASWATR